MGAVSAPPLRLPPLTSVHDLRKSHLILVITMLRPTATGKAQRTRPPGSDSRVPAVELKFIADLGRSLLVSVHPKNVASKVAEAVRECSGAARCAFLAELRNIGLVTCCFSDSGEVEAPFLDRARFERLFDILPPQIGHGTANPDEFLLTDSAHGFEYVSP